MVRVTFHVVGCLKVSISDLCYRKLFMVGFLSRDDRGICGQEEVDARVGPQIGLEFCQVNIQGSIKSEGSSDGRHFLANKVVKICVGGAFKVKVSMTNVINGFIVYHEVII
jgi:hypothetical protein